MKFLQRLKAWLVQPDPSPAYSGLDLASTPSLRPKVTPLSPQQAFDDARRAYAANPTLGNRVALNVAWTTLCRRAES